MGWTKERVNDDGKIRYQAWWRDHRGHATEPIALQTRTPASSAPTTASGPCLVEDGRPDSPGISLLFFLRESGGFLLSFP